MSDATAEDTAHDVPHPSGGLEGPREAGDVRPSGRRPAAPFVLTGPPLPWRRPSIMWRHIYTGAMGSTYANLVTGLFLVAYGGRLGVTYRAWGMLGGLVSFALLLQIVGAHLSSALGKRREVWFACAMTERLLRGLAIAAAFYIAPMGPLITSAVFVVILAASSAFGAMAAAPWYSWLADLLPAEEQGRFWGRRDAWVSFVTAAVLVPCAVAYDEFRSTDMHLPVLLTIFALALALGYVDLFIHRTIPEPPMAAGPKRSILKEVVEVLRDRAFRPWLVFICLWNFAMTLGASLAAVYFVETLFERSLLFGILAASVVPLAMGVLTSRRMGALVDRFGARTVLRFGHLIWTLVPLPWVFATPATAVWLVAGSNILGMPAINAATNAAIKYVTRFATSEKRAMYWAVSSSLASLAGGLGAVVTGEALEFLRGWSVDVAGWTLSGFRAVFVASIALRFVAALFTWRLPAPPAEQAGR